MKISAVYKISNVITGDFYIGSSKNVKRRWAEHKCPSTWNRCLNNPMYLDMQKYGVDKFEFKILEEAEVDSLKVTEQKFIETLKPTYNSNRANGWNIDRYKEHQKKWQEEYRKTDKSKEYQKQYDNQLCLYNSETLTLGALRTRFWRRGISNPTAEAKRYLIGGNDD